MNKPKYFYYPPLFYFILWIAVILFSWLGSLYELVQASPQLAVEGESSFILRNLLSAEAVRWFVRSAGEHILRTPLGDAVLILITLGVLYKSGFTALIYRLIQHRKPSLKQKRAITIALALFCISVCILLLGGIGAQGILLGVTGSLSYSPFLDGLLFIVSLIFSLVGTVYGVTSGEFRNAGEIVEGFSCLLSVFASYIVTLFLASQLTACMEYAHIPRLLGLSDGTFYILSQFFYWLPFVYCLFCWLRIKGLRPS